MKLVLKLLSYTLVGIIAGVGGFVISRKLDNSNSQPEVIKQIIPRPLEKYSFDNLINTSIPQGEIIKQDQYKNDEDFLQYIFKLDFDPTLTEHKLATTTGLMTLPTTAGPYPLIIMFRGYVDPSVYFPGNGTHRAAEEFAKNGYMSIAPDFLGYAGSSENAKDPLESRFQTYTTALTIMNSIDSLPDWDHKNIFIWGHSNGGQIALTALEITQKDWPSVLWAPVSKPFPYSVLYYTDDSEDNGKFLRKQISDFENLYDSEKYSLTNYLDRIKAPIQLHQGTADNAVPRSWSDSLDKNLKDKNLDITYYVYLGADHNLTPGWELAVERNFDFFRKYVK